MTTPKQPEITPQQTILAVLLSWKRRFGPKCARVTVFTDEGQRLVFDAQDVDAALAVTLHLCTNAEGLQADLAVVRAELQLLKEAAQDMSLSEGALRAVITGMQPPTDDDIRWAQLVACRAELAQVTQERDDARADAGELDAIKALVSDRDEVGCYAKVEAADLELASLRGDVETLKGYVQHKDECEIWMKLDDGSTMVVPDAAGLPDYKCTCGLARLLSPEGSL